ncbi:MAG: serine protease, partial [Azorhizobium sp. 12-66-6]
MLACAGVFGLLALAATGDARAQTAPAASQTQRAQVPATRSEITLSFAPVVARTAPAVVNVYALKSAPRSNPFFDDPFFRRFFGGGQGGDGPGLGGPERMQRSLGSGVIVDPSGLVVTNHHVIQGGDQIRIALNDKREFD